MSELDLHEQEQVDAIKAWWKENSSWVYGLVTVSLLAFAGSQFWKQHQASQSTGAASLYAEVMKQTASGDAKLIGDAADALADRFSASPYAARAQLLAAQTSQQAADPARAKARLWWVIEHSEEEGLQHVARLKLAAMLLDEGKYDDALKQLGTAHPAAFDSVYADLKGDVQVAMGKVDDARISYKLAMEKTEAQAAQRNLIQLKLDGLGNAK
ncbi:MAG: tetratricopeptide repeat protein [Gammaproteobacteria bacterium]|nr:tetratricopeptide repeat protein [Gammaproteobacteria bacterium]MBU1625300.1 tetratricopeptide repeat protein [Gammaproteobacteria bacterium]MBU1981560.1 tetratricopeptide repeat protein [Gammaproteobacteria bacterium]